ncbi:MAG: hypothetical protein HWE27_05640 [Gammaproteobacteria bacterium]|nr:hypothetical protein [Gammaproteobacteria bacterium]
MKFKHLGFAFISLPGLLAISGCEITSDSNSSDNFTFQVVSTDACGNVMGIPNQDVLVYDENPIENPSSGFTTLQTDSNGRVVIDSTEENASFTLNADYFGNMQLIYSFYEIEPGNHIFRLNRTTGPTDNCSCQSFTIDTELFTGHTYSDVKEAQIFWGNTEQYVTADIENFADASYTFRKCGNPNSQISVLLETHNDEFIYGNISRPNLNGSAIYVAVDKVAQKELIPQHSDFASVSIGNVVEGNLHMVTNRYNTQHEDYPLYDRMNESLQYSRYYADIDSSESGVIFVPDGPYKFASNSILQFNNSGLEMSPVLNGATYIELSNPSKKAFSINSDIERSTNLSLTMSRFYEADGNVISWYTYGPSSTNFQLPSIQPEWEQRIEDGNLMVRYVEVSEISGAQSSSEAIELRRFLNTGGYMNNSPYTERSTYIAVDATINKSQTMSAQEDKSDLLIDNY